MNLNKRIEIVVRLGELLRNENWENIIQESISRNHWFTKNWVNLSLSSWSQALTKSNVSEWLNRYPTLTNPVSREVQIVMAGNLPLVGLHDLLCTFISGHKANAKLSSKDSVLMVALFKILSKEFHELTNYISFSNELNPNPEAIIATGTDNTRKYFESLYPDIPGIFRGNRNSIAVLSGTESNAELASLCHDIRSYFGLGCRNVSHIIFPDRVILKRFSEILSSTREEIENQGYNNSLIQNRAIFTLLKKDFIDTKDVLLLVSDQISSPVGVINYQISASENYTKSWISKNANSIQCVVSVMNNFGSVVLPGQSQYPELWDYADNIDTLNFLIKLSSP